MTTGTSEQHIKSTVTLTDLRDKPIPGICTGSIADQNQTAGFPGDLFQWLAAPTDQHQIGAFACVQSGAGGTDAGSCTGNDNRAWLRHRDTPCG
ncbi:hypothetical protein D3C81_1726400 [compost metagenome]